MFQKKKILAVMLSAAMVLTSAGIQSGVKKAEAKSKYVTVTSKLTIVAGKKKTIKVKSKSGTVIKSKKFKIIKGSKSKLTVSKKGVVKGKKAGSYKVRTTVKFKRNGKTGTKKFITKITVKKKSAKATNTKAPVVTQSTGNPPATSTATKTPEVTKGPSYPSATPPFTAEESEKLLENAVSIAENKKTSNGEGNYKDGKWESLFAELKDVSGQQYIKVVYTSEDTLDGAMEIFDFKPYSTSKWDGWDSNKIRVSDSSYDTLTGQYTVYVSVEKIAASYSGSDKCGAINIEYVHETNPVISVVSVSYLHEGNEEDLATLAKPIENHYTRKSFPDTLTLADFQQTACYAYIQVTKCTPYSWIRTGASSTGENGTVKGGSNKSLTGPKHSVQDNCGNYIIHQSYGTANEGTGKGSVGTGIYKSNKFGINSGKLGHIDDYYFYMDIKTKDTEAHVLGILMGNTYYELDQETQTFKVGTKPDDSLIEALGTDESDRTAEEKEELEKVEEEKANNMRAALKTAIDYCKLLKADDYTAGTFADLAGAITTAETAYAKTDSTYLEYKDARDDLELVRTSLAPNPAADSATMKTFRILGKDAVIQEMGAGINIGNTMDGHVWWDPSETSWQGGTQGVKITKAYVKALHDAGYNTVRIPVTWGKKIKNDYTIDEAWLNRVKEIVDYCVDQDMYAIINIHHDGTPNHDNRGNNTVAKDGNDYEGSWLDTYATDTEAIYQKFGGVWKNIAEKFKDYDEHLIFESMNEVTDAHDGTANEDTKVLNCLNNLFVNTVRATGSNNRKRWLAITGRFATYSIGTTAPADTLADKGTAGTTRMMFAVHIYKGMHEAQANYSTLEQYKSSLESTKKYVEGVNAPDVFKEPDMPIYIGEYGKDHLDGSGGADSCNKYDRALDGEYFSALCKINGICPIVWDQGAGTYNTGEAGDTTADEKKIFYYWNRLSCKPVDKETIDGAMRGSYLMHAETGSVILEKIYKRYGYSDTNATGWAAAPTLTKITAIEITGGNTVNMTTGSRQTIAYTTTPAEKEHDDVVLWSTSDDSVVTVSQGVLHAKKAGTATITYTTQEGGVTGTITVTVADS